MQTSSETFAEFAWGLSASDIPPRVVEATALHWLDTAGCALAAVGLGEFEESAEFAEFVGGSGQAAVIGRAERRPAQAAAFVNGTLAHALDFDSTHPTGAAHIATVL